MSYTKTLSKVGAMVGFGFGLFTAYSNFDPDAHQSETMDDHVKYLSELFTQIGMIAIQTTSIKMLSKLVGILCDNASIVYQTHQNKILPSKLKEASDEAISQDSKIKLN